MNEQEKHSEACKPHFKEHLNDSNNPTDWLLTPIKLPFARSRLWIRGNEFGFKERGTTEDQRPQPTREDVNEGSLLVEGVVVLKRLDYCISSFRRKSQADVCLENNQLEEKRTAPDDSAKDLSQDRIG